ncbi:MAG: hypothetical protein OEW84_05140 [Aigarchaeota archaeon]|nr:hypothetical protein [Aigarchaeota archaeon]
MLAICFFAGYLNIASYAEVAVQDVQVQAKPFVFIFLIVSGLLLPYSTMTREPFRLLNFDPVLSSNPWYPIAALVLGATTGALLVRNSSGSMKVAAIAFLLLILLWLPSAMMTAHHLYQRSSAVMVSTDAIISEFVLNRPFDLLTAFLVPIATAGLVGAAASLNYREIKWRMLSRMRRVLGLYDVE